MARASYPTVDRGHIVPRMYQKAFAVSGNVAVHAVGRATCRLTSTKSAGTRGPFYRRTRPGGELIDDVEASLAVVENKSAPVLRATVSGAPIDLEAKGILAQFFGVQLMRGPAFFEQRDESLSSLIDELGVDQFRPAALADAGYDLAALRQKLLGVVLDPTQHLVTMLQYATKVAGILGNMRWHIVRFANPVVAYSDHPVVLWPSGISASAPFRRQHLGPLGAYEVRIPIAPDRAIVMNWLDLPDPEEIELGVVAAAELNAFTVGQAETEWMHLPGTEPPIAEGTFIPLSRLVADEYGDEALTTSRRRAHASAWFAANQGRPWVDDLELVVL
ncbi:MAG TPA: DUF4238 domain-containing protein [Solirubrobacteraceae bacterium]|nr:DUF4238 domain-containing protein [Solirubrobacteraceae bacterium]